MTATSVTWERDDKLYDERLVVGENHIAIMSRLTSCLRPQIS